MRKTFVLAMFALMLTAPASQAMMGGGEWMGGGQAGVHIPSGDYGDLFKSGFDGGVFLDYKVSNMFAMGADLDFHSTKGKDTFVNSVSGATDIKFTAFQYGVHGNAYLMNEGMVRPYIAAGLGAYSDKFKIEGGSFAGEDTKTKFGFHGGLGIKLQPSGSPIGFAVEGNIHDIPDAIEQSNGDKKAAQFFTGLGKVTFSFSDVTQQKK